MNAKIRRQLAARKRRVERRIDKRNSQGCEAPMMRPSNIKYELAQRTQGLAYGGLGAMRLLVQKLGLAEAIDRRLHLLKIHLPYHESDHVLNLAFNALCDGDCLEDLELRRNDEVYLNALGARRIPDPTTAGDFCRRFESLTSAGCKRFSTKRGTKSGPGNRPSSLPKRGWTWTACSCPPAANANKAWTSLSHKSPPSNSS